MWTFYIIFFYTSTWSRIEYKYEFHSCVIGYLYATSADNASFQCLWQFTTRNVKRFPFISSIWQGITLYLILAILMVILRYIIMILINVLIITNEVLYFIFYWTFNIFFCEAPFHIYWPFFLYYCFFLIVLWRLFIYSKNEPIICYISYKYLSSVLL